MSSDVPSERDDNNARNLERKPPVAPPRKSPRNSYSDEDIGFLSKLTKFEMLSGRGGNSVSPKVFPPGASTTSVPAEQILGRSRSSGLATFARANNPNRQSPLRNLTNFETNSASRNNGPPRRQHRRSSDCENGETRSDAEGRDISSRSPSESELCVRETNPGHNPVLGKITNRRSNGSIGADEGVNDNDNSNDNDNDNEDNDSRSCFGSNPKTRRIQAPSPAFDRDPRYDEAKRRDHRWRYGGVESPTPSNASGCSLEQLDERRYDAENKRRMAQEERLREQEIEKQDRLRLEEILAMCAEYERQSTTLERPRQPNRIKTNGSLPRDKRPGYNSPFGSPESPAKIQHRRYFSFETTNKPESLCSPSRENLSNNNKNHKNKNNNNNNNRNNDVDDEEEEEEDYREKTKSSSNELSTSPNDCRTFYNNNNNNNSNGKDDGRTNDSTGFSASVSQACRGQRNYDESTSPIQDGKINRDMIFGTIRLNGTRIDSGDSMRNYENIVATKGDLSLRSNNDSTSSLYRQRNNPRTPSSCQVIENKLTISNDDLLEAIQQLSMLAATKSKDVVVVVTATNNSTATTPKRDNVEREQERKQLEDKDRRKYIEFLHNEKLHILGNMDVLERSIAEIELQEDELNREVELEKALLSAEYDSESLELTGDESDKIRTQMRINELEREMTEDSGSQANLQAEAKHRVQHAQRICNHLEKDLEACEGDEESSSKRQGIMEKLAMQQDVLESERKAFEDLEFHHLEEEASKLATREELQRHLSELSAKIEARKVRLDNLEAQRSTIKNSATKEASSLERQKLAHVRRLKEGRSRLRAIEDELENLMRNPPENCEENKRSPSREDFDRISRVTTDSPIVNHHGSLGRKTIESLKEIERNRQLHLAKQGSQVISEERRRVEELKRRVQDEVRSQWEERKMNCASFNSIESGEESSSHSTGLTESGSGSSDGVEVGNIEKISTRKIDEFASSSPGPSNDSYTLLLHGNDMRDDRITTTMEADERLSVKSVITIEENESRPMSQTSSEMDSVGPLQSVKHRDKPKLQRPLTRYLPIKSESLDLRHHIETAGHHLPLIRDVAVDTTTCAGYLSKMSKKFHHWNKRWFVFDRKGKTLSYYSDNSTKKARGIIYFQSIEEVYIDHMNTVRSPQPSLTFIIKTTTRLYHLMAPSPEAMRVWVDVVFTGAEGYHEFDHGI